MGESTLICYAVYSNQGCHENYWRRLSEAKRHAQDLRRKMADNVEIIRYDRSGYSKYWEVVKG